MILKKALEVSRVLAPYLVGLVAVALLFRAGQLPLLAPAAPKAAREKKPTAQGPRRPRAAAKLGTGTTEVPAMRLLDHLKTARKTHPDLVQSYRRLARGKGAPGHWRHYIDPWSKLEGSLKPLRVQMNFAVHDARAYCRPKGWTRPVRGRANRAARPSAGKRARRPARIRRQFGRDKFMNKTPGVNAMRLSLFAPTPASFTFRVTPPKGGALAFGAGVPINGTRGPVTFLVELARGKEPAKVISTFTVKHAQRHQWHDRRVDLSAWQGQPIQLTLRTKGPAGAFAFWSNPVIWKPGAAHPGKNVIFILVDTLRADGVRSVTGKHAVTPHMDAFGKQGVSFTKAFSMASWTRSSLLGIFTSEHVTRFDPRLNTTFKPHRRFVQKMYRRWPRLLTWHLKEQGFWLEAIVNNFFLPAYTPIGFDRGFDHVTDIRAHVHDTPAITRGAVRFLRANKDRPFFLYLHYDGPHQPYWSPKGYRVKGARPPGGPHDREFEKYLGESRWTDTNLAPLFSELKKLGLDKNTVVVLTGDHGEVFHQAHDYLIGPSANRTLHHHGWSVYEEVLHVPLFLVGPGLPVGKKIADPVSHIDLAPTLLEAAGLPPMKGTMGRSLLPAIRKGTPMPQRPICAVARWSYGMRKGRWRYIHRYGSGRSLRSPRRPERKVHVMGELYDLQADPEETKNLIRKRPELAAKLKKELLSIVLGGGGRPQGPVTSPTTGPGTGPATHAPKGKGIRLSMRLWGGQGHTLAGSIQCPGTVIVRSLRGPVSRATYRNRGRVDVELKNTKGRTAEAEIELVGCSAASVKLALKLDDKPLKQQQVVVGPVGLALMPKPPTRLLQASLPAFVSRRPPAQQPSTTPRVHLWLGSSYQGDLNLDGARGAAAKLADQMLRDAGYSKGPSKKNRPRPRP